MDKFGGRLECLCTVLWNTPFSIALSKTALLMLYKRRIDIYAPKKLDCMHKERYTKERYSKGFKATFSLCC
jgi:cytochrome c-type biogenesis protein CcmH/NrfF